MTLLRLLGDPKKVQDEVRALARPPQRITHPGRDLPDPPKRKRAALEDVKQFFARHMGG